MIWTNGCLASTTASRGDGAVGNGKSENVLNVMVSVLGDEKT